MTSEERLKNLLVYLNDDPSDASTKYMIALENIKANNDLEAHKWMENIFTEHPSYLPNYYHYGKLLERKGDIKAAVLIYKQGIEQAELSKDFHTRSELKSALETIE